MNKPCDVCGDIGYDDVIGICSQCKETHEHIYCMRILYDGELEKWVCSECQSPSQALLTSPVVSKPIEGSKIRFTIKRPLLSSKVQYLSPEEVMGLESGAPKSKFSPSKIPRRDRSGFKRLPPKFSVKPNPRVGPPAIGKPLNPRSIPRSSSDEKWLAAVKEKSVTHRQHAWKESAVSMGWSSRSAPLYNCTEEKVTGEGPGGDECQGTTANPRSSRELSNTGTTRESKDSRQLVQGLHSSSSGILKTSTETENKEQLVQCLQAAGSETENKEELVYCLQTASSETEKKEELVYCLQAASSEKEPQCHSSDALTRPSPFSELQELIMEKCADDVWVSTKQNGTDTESMESSKVAIKFEKSLPNHPAESPTWRGKFDVTSNVSSCGFYDGIVAHPPSKVHRKVYELSKHLPKMLHFELLPRLSLWVELFDKDIPGATDIGLYLLPSKSCEEMYFCLVERLNECDMLLKGCVNGVELLIFSSKNLQDGCEQIDQRYFLWGVFRSCEDSVMGDKETSAGIAAPIDDQTCWMEEDMEVDMIGGQEMENADKVVAKPAQPVLDDATPEFSPVKVKKDIPSPGCDGGSGSGNGTQGVSLLIKHELAFERELQRCFDNLDAACMKGRGIRAVKLDN